MSNNKLNRPSQYQGNSIAMDQAHSKDSAKKVLKKVKAVKKKVHFWLEDLSLKSRYEFHSKEQFESTVKTITSNDQNKRLRASHPRLLNQIRNQIIQSQFKSQSNEKSKNHKAVPAKL